MGVAGCGKTSVGQAVAARLGATFLDGDDLHPASNIAKMSAGAPLTDADRAPWLAQVGAILRDVPHVTLIGCSALKRSYRDIIRQAAAAPVGFLHLAAARAVIAARMADRQGHFMPLSLLDSQYAALEHLQPDEIGLTVHVGQSLDALADEILTGLDHLTRP